ncbi:MAG: hypothetical protein KOO61_09480 [Spirochaetales bacterium]|nr:hypothetical protein [Spirochaetales bacterium]
MRRSLTILLLLLGAIAVSAQPLDPFQPANPIVMGRGGSFTATASGYNSFFCNPAGFARDGELTLTSANLWAFMDRDLVSLAQDFAGTGLSFLPQASSASIRAIDPAAFEGLEGYFTDLADWAAGAEAAGADLEAIIVAATGDTDITITSEADLAEIIAAAGTEDVIAFLEAVEQAATDAGYPLPFTVDDLEAAIASALPSGYLRIGGMVGLGYVGNGIGLGLFANVEGVVDGTNVLQATGMAYNTITFVGGLGLSFGNLHLGLAIRPTIFGYSEISAAPILAGYLSGGSLDLTSVFANAVYFGSGLGVDVGALYELGPFSFGIAVKDLLGTQIAYRRTTFDEYYQAIIAASLPLGNELTAAEEDAAWTIPMKVNVGAEFHPDLGVVSFLFDPSVSVDLLDLSLAIRTFQSGQQMTTDQILSMLNFGGEMNLLRFLSIRGGYYGGYLSAGVGLDIFLVDIHAAIAGDFGRDAAGQWGFSNVGGSVEFAFRL